MESWEETLWESPERIAFEKVRVDLGAHSPGMQEAWEMKWEAEAGVASKSQQEERRSDATLSKGRTAVSLPGSETGDVFLSDFDGVGEQNPDCPELRDWIDFKEMEIVAECNSPQEVWQERKSELGENQRVPRKRKWES